MNGLNCSCDLFFKNVFVRNSTGTKVIVNNLSGHFTDSSFIGILGPSGCGKTTLMNSLSGYRHQHSSVEVLEVNGEPMRFEDMNTISSYITQDIYLNDSLTTEENMRFAADFKLGDKYAQSEKKTIIDELIDSLGLLHAISTKAGKLSGGERKRLAVAMEMISNPKIMYLDEPTTGLDICAANQMLNYLKSLSVSGRIVICTIHQMSAGHLKMFDLIYAIADGQCAYFGPPQKMLSFLNELGLNCSLYHNAADFLLEVCSGEYGSDKPELLITAAKTSDQHQNKNEKYENNAIELATFRTSSTNSYKLKTLLWREFIKTRRNPFFICLRLCCINVVAILVCLLFGNVGNDASNAPLNYKVIMCINASTLLSGLLFPILTFPFEMNVVKREVHNNYYTAGHYYIATFVIDSPVTLTMATTSSLIIYYFTGQLMEYDRIVIYLTTTLLFSFVIAAVGFFFGTMFSIGMAFIGVIVVHLPMLAITGFAIIIKDLPYVIDVISRLTYLRHNVIGEMVAMFGRNRTDLLCPDDKEFCMYADANKFMADFGFDPNEFLTSYYVLATWLVAMHIITYLAVKYRLCHV